MMLLLVMEFFVAVGNDEIIYTSTDGDAWTKVYGK